MKFKEKIKNINFQTLNHDLTIVISNDVHKSREIRGHILGPTDLPPENIRAMHSTNGLGKSFLFIPHDADVGEVAHESYHCVWTVMKFINAQHENEIVAYALTFVVRSVHDTLKAYHQMGKRRKRLPLDKNKKK